MFTWFELKDGRLLCLETGVIIELRRGESHCDVRYTYKGEQPLYIFEGRKSRKSDFETVKKNGQDCFNRIKEHLGRKIVKAS